MVAIIRRRSHRLTALGWQAPRFEDQSGAGLDFLYMHREMIRTMDQKLATLNDPYWRRVEGWDPIPWANNDPEWPVPLWTNPPEGAAWARLPATVERMKQLDQLLRDPNWLRTKSLDEIGRSMEFTIHSWMHLHWSGPPPADVNSEDVSNDWLYIPWSSHVNKHFWKLHGWIDNRISDWERATGVPADFTALGGSSTSRRARSCRRSGDSRAWRGLRGAGFGARDSASTNPDVAERATDRPLVGGVQTYSTSALNLRRRFVHRPAPAR